MKDVLIQLSGHVIGSHLKYSTRYNWFPMANEKSLDDPVKRFCVGGIGLEPTIFLLVLLKLSATMT